MKEIKCPKCNESAIYQAIEKRERISCNNCGFMEYEDRGTCGPYFHMVDAIADSVAKSKHHEEDALVLINSCFKSSNPEGSKELIQDWCNLHGFNFKTDFDAKGGVKGQFILFSRI